MTAEEIIRSPNIVEVNKLVIEKEPYIIKTGIEGLLLLKRPRYDDDRGGFQERTRLSSIEKDLGMEEGSLAFRQLQDSESKPGVLRGIHVEPQYKLITPITGRMLAVIVDVRPDSETFKKWIMFDFDCRNIESQRTTVFVPKGLGNSMCVVSSEDDPLGGVVFYSYAVTEEYNSATAGMAIRYDDGELAIPWPDDVIVSDRDRGAYTLEEFMNIYGEKYRNLI